MSGKVKEEPNAADDNEPWFEESAKYPDIEEIILKEEKIDGN